MPRRTIGRSLLMMLLLLGASVVTMADEPSLPPRSVEAISSDYDPRSESLASV
jgi:hypothetical protein